MDGHDYEYLVAKYLRGHGYTGVKVTKGSGDFGVDVVHKISFLGSSFDPVSAAAPDALQLVAGDPVVLVGDPAALADDRA